MCSIVGGPQRSKRQFILPLPLFFALLIANTADAQIFLSGVPPASEYGRVILDNHSSEGSPGPVLFDHWLHRSKFTCRLCHVDIGFAMRESATGIKASTNQQDFHCGACHNGKRVINGKVTFPSCSLTATSAEKQQCSRCHSLGKSGVRQFSYEKFTAKFPKDIYGIAWEQAERTGVIKPIDALEGLSIPRAPMKSRGNLAIQANAALFSDVRFSHEKHSIWNGCEVCHPDIFPPAQKGAVKYSMYKIARGGSCGVCHGSVAFPVNSCHWCHSGGVPWFQGPGHFP